MRNIIPDNRCVHGITIGVRCSGCESGKCHHGFPLDRHCPTCATFRKPTAPRDDTWYNLADVKPVRGGWFRVVIKGDDAIMTEGYAYPSYETFAFCAIDEENEPNFQGTHDEETSMVLAWYGPIEIPAYKDGK